MSKRRVLFVFFLKEINSYRSLGDMGQTNANEGHLPPEKGHATNFRDRWLEHNPWYTRRWTFVSDLLLKSLTDERDKAKPLEKKRSMMELRKEFDLWMIRFYSASSEGDEDELRMINRKLGELGDQIATRGDEIMELEEEILETMQSIERVYEHMYHGSGPSLLYRSHCDNWNSRIPDSCCDKLKSTF